MFARRLETHMAADALTKPLAIAENRLNLAARTAERAVRRGIHALRRQAHDDSRHAGRAVECARRYLLKRVKERPVTATFAGLGVGFLLGILLSGRGR
jgi:ElaB/YqjD/DUF883 family membrane-anchored ribosome-binding protein